MNMRMLVMYQQANGRHINWEDANYVSCFINYFLNQNTQVLTTISLALTTLKMALAAYRHLLRSSRIAFQGTFINPS